MIENLYPIKPILFFIPQTSTNQVFHPFTHEGFLRINNPFNTLLFDFLKQLFDIIGHNFPRQPTKQNLKAHTTKGPYITLMPIFLKMFPTQHLRSHISRCSHYTIHKSQILSTFSKTKISQLHNLILYQNITRFNIPA
jgi:hypothetical protein